MPYMVYRGELIGLTHDFTPQPLRPPHRDPPRPCETKAYRGRAEFQSFGSHDGRREPLPRAVRVILGGAQNHDTERGNPQRHRAGPVVPGNLFGRDLAQVAHAGATINFGVRV